MTLLPSNKYLSIFALFLTLTPGCDPGDPGDPGEPADARDAEVIHVDELLDADELRELPPLESVLADAVDPQGLPPNGYQDCFIGIGPGASCFQCICVDADTRSFQYYCSGCLN